MSTPSSSSTPAASLSPDDRKALIDSLDFSFSPAVFDTADRFPPRGFRNAELVKRYFGDVTVSNEFYAADFTPVEKPNGPGRYGVITKLRFPTGEVIEKQQTLYLIPVWLNNHLPAPEVHAVFSAKLGVDPAVSNQPAAGRYVSEAFNEARSRDGRAAALLAWLAKVPAGSPPLPDRLGPGAADEAWWYQLRVHRGETPTYAFLLHRPSTYDADPVKKWPLVIFLHGSGERGMDAQTLQKGGPIHILMQKNDFVVACPQCPVGEGWNPDELNAFLEKVRAENRIDPDRIYLSGGSMGAFGAWRWALVDPELFAALVPLSGGGDASDAARLRTMPIWAFHGAKDMTVDPGLSRTMVDAVNAAGGHAQLTLYPDVGHDSWEKAYVDPELFTWLLAQHRPGK